jgi:uncharacterized lipoprotein YehR (DUF1307 family)
MANKTDKKIDYSLSFNVDGGWCQTSISFKTDKEVKKLDETTIKIGNLKISTSEEITSLQYLYKNKWTDLK